MESVVFDERIYPLRAYRITGREPQMFWRFITETQGTLLVKPLQYGPLKEPIGLPNQIHSIYDVLHHESISQIQWHQQLSRGEMSPVEFDEVTTVSLMNLVQQLTSKRLSKGNAQTLLDFIIHDDSFVPDERKTYLGGIRIFHRDVISLISKIQGATGVDILNALRRNMLGNQYEILIRELCDEGLSLSAAEAEVSKVNYLLGYHQEQKMTSFDDPPLKLRSRYIYCESIEPVVADAGDRSELTALKGVDAREVKEEVFEYQSTYFEFVWRGNTYALGRATSLAAIVKALHEPWLKGQKQKMLHSKDALKYVDGERVEHYLKKGVGRRLFEDGFIIKPKRAYWRLNLEGMKSVKSEG